MVGSRPLTSPELFNAYGRHCRAARASEHLVIRSSGLLVNSCLLSNRCAMHAQRTSPLAVPCTLCSAWPCTTSSLRCRADEHPLICLSCTLTTTSASAAHNCNLRERPSCAREYRRAADLLDQCLAESGQETESPFGACKGSVL